MKIWGYKRDLDLLLINTPLSDYSQQGPESTPFQPAMGLAVLASYLDRRGFRVGVWDAEADKIAPAGIAEGIALLKPRWAGFNTFTSSFEILADTIRRVAQISPETRLMLGGADVTTGYEYYLTSKAFERAVLVKHDGELKTEAILGGKRLEEISGIVFISAEGVITTKESRDWLVQDIGSPSFSLNREFVSYDPTFGNTGPDGKRRAFIASSRGCPYECTFCASSRLLKEGLLPRYREPGDVVRELVEIIEAGVLDIKFNDELVWASEKRIREILDPLKEMGHTRETGLELRGNGRVNVIARASDATLDVMQEVGVRKVGMGVEQGTVEGMERIKKRITPEEVIVATRRLAERGIPALVNFMFGLPGQNEKETKAVVALARDLVLIGRHYGVDIELDGYKYRPYQGTELWDELLKKGYSPEDLRKVIQVPRAGERGGSHLQVEPFLNLGEITFETEWEHRRVLNQLTEMTYKELWETKNKYPSSLYLEGQYSRSPERR